MAPPLLRTEVTPTPRWFPSATAVLTVNPTDTALPADNTATTTKEAEAAVKAVKAACMR